jgi:hypothetical protein
VVEELGEQGRYAATIEHFVPFAAHLGAKRRSVAASNIRNAQHPLFPDEPVVQVEGQPTLPGVNALVVLAEDPKGRNMADMVMVREGFLPKLDFMWQVRTQVRNPRWTAAEGATFDWKDECVIAEDSNGNLIRPRIPWVKGKVWFVTRILEKDGVTTIICACKLEAQDGMKITTRQGFKGTISVVPDEEMPLVEVLTVGKMPHAFKPENPMPKWAQGMRRADLLINPQNLARRQSWSLLLEALTGLVVEEKGLGSIQVPVNATKAWFDNLLEMHGYDPAMMRRHIVVEEKGKPQSVGFFFPGVVQVLIQPQHPEVVGKFRMDRWVCPECGSAVDNDAHICLSCFCTARPLSPTSPTGLSPDAGRYGVKWIRPYTGNLKMRGCLETLQDIKEKRNPEISALVSEFFDMLHAPERR